MSYLRLSYSSKIGLFGSPHGFYLYLFCNALNVIFHRVQKNARFLKQGSVRASLAENWRKIFLQSFVFSRLSASSSFQLLNYYFSYFLGSQRHKSSTLLLFSNNCQLNYENLMSFSLILDSCLLICRIKSKSIFVTLLIRKKEEEKFQTILLLYTCWQVRELMSRAVIWRKYCGYQCNGLRQIQYIS